MSHNETILYQIYTFNTKEVDNVHQGLMIIRVNSLCFKST